MDISEIIADYRRMSDSGEYCSRSVVRRLREAIPNVGAAGARCDALLAAYDEANADHKRGWYAERGISEMDRALDLGAPDAPELPVPDEAYVSADEYRRLLIQCGAIADGGAFW